MLLHSSSFRDRCKGSWQGHTDSFHNAAQQVDVNVLSQQVSSGLFKTHLMTQINTPSKPHTPTADSFF